MTVGKRVKAPRINCQSHIKSLLKYFEFYKCNRLFAGQTNRKAVTDLQNAYFYIDQIFMPFKLPNTATDTVTAAIPITVIMTPTLAKSLIEK